MDLKNWSDGHSHLIDAEERFLTIRLMSPPTGEVQRLPHLTACAAMEFT
jgi:hypothetical protein